MAPFRAALYPPRMASEPPVKKPAIWVQVSKGNPLRRPGTTCNRVPRVFLLPNAFYGAVERAELLIYFLAKSLTLFLRLEGNYQAAPDTCRSVSRSTSHTP